LSARRVPLVTGHFALGCKLGCTLSCGGVPGGYRLADVASMTLRRVGVSFRPGTRCIICTELSTPEPLHEIVLAIPSLATISEAAANMTEYRIAPLSGSKPVRRLASAVPSRSLARPSNHPAAQARRMRVNLPPIDPPERPLFLANFLPGIARRTAASR
jgi:hypothetical protein